MQKFEESFFFSPFLSFFFLSYCYLFTYFQLIAEKEKYGGQRLENNLDLLPE